MYITLEIRELKKSMKEREIERERETYRILDPWTKDFPSSRAVGQKTGRADSH